MKFSLPKFFNKKRTPENQVNATKRYIAYSGGTLVNAETCMEVSAMFRGVNYISTQIAKLPWEVKDKKNNILYNDKVMNLLDLAPNNEMSAFNFKTFLIAQAIIRGNAYAEIERNILGVPVALHLIPTEMVQIRRNLASGDLIYRVVGGGYNSQDVDLKPYDVFHLRNLYTKDGIMGDGVVAYAITTLGISLGADSFANGLFSNGGLPSVALEVPGVLEDEEYERIKESWKQAHGGRKTGGVVILEEGMKASPISFSPDILQFLESRKFSVLEIARFLGLPPTKLFDADSAKFNNIEHANLEVATDTLDAWAKNLELEADIKLLNYRYGGKHTELDLYAVFRGDMSTRATYFQKMMQSGAMTPNEIREKEGMPGYEGGDRFYIASNNFTPSDRLDEVIDSQIEPKDTANDQMDTPEEDNGEKELNQAIANFLADRTKKINE